MTTAATDPTRPTRRGAARWFLMAVALLAWGTAAAQPGLYGPETPSDAAWVRVLNLAAPGGIAVRIADDGALVLPAGGATRYTPVTPGAVRLDVGGTDVDIEVEPESFTTVALTADGLRVVSDPALRDASRGLLGLLNLTDRPALGLRVPDGTVVVAEVPPGSHAAIAVARATTELLVTDDEEPIARLEPRSFERGVAYVVVVFDAPTGPGTLLISSVAD